MENYAKDNTKEMVSKCVIECRLFILMRNGVFSEELTLFINDIIIYLTLIQLLIFLHLLIMLQHYYQVALSFSSKSGSLSQVRIMLSFHPFLFFFSFSFKLLTLYINSNI
ncbi:hypothetical protein C2G38_1024922 [Gigaspora rosea]|uniref:Uncharacterized protein n=1 Tax=Gigaspora rosea TaxID=44941 RepID=A0A397VK07_9GLOM|nr:hypothetical protein C2G38_1024922 [Gigaspora rosea]